MSQLRNPVKTCAWCKHPMEVHIFTEDIPDQYDPVRIPCAHCPDNTCDIEKLDPHGGEDGSVTLQLP